MEVTLAWQVRTSAAAVRIPAQLADQSFPTRISKMTALSHSRYALTPRLSVGGYRGVVLAVAVLLIMHSGCQRNSPAAKGARPTQPDKGLAGQTPPPAITPQTKTPPPETKPPETKPLETPPAQSVDAQTVPANAAQDKDPPEQSGTIEVHPEIGRFTEAQLGKDHTVMVLAFDSITRQTYFLSNFRHLMNEEQVRQTRELVDSYDGRFAELRDDRARILENATDSPDVETMLLNNRVETLLLGRALRQRLFREILTREQKKLHMQESKLRQARRKALEAAHSDSPPADSN